jgi:hypothetical protein
MHPLSCREIPFEVLSLLGEEISFRMIIRNLQESLNLIFTKSPISTGHKSKTMEGYMTLIKSPTDECILLILSKSATHKATSKGCHRVAHY